MSNPLRELERFGQSPWIDSISREMLSSGRLQRMIEEDGLKGLTSNPTIFDKAISTGADYDATLSRLVEQGHAEPKGLFELLAAEDIRDAADLLRPVHEETGGTDGFASLEVSPTLAHDTEGTVAEAKRLFELVGRSNVMIKIPATQAGLPAIARVIGEGIPVNVTLIFSVARYLEVVEAYLSGLEALARSGKNLSAVSSVASFFVSRIDTAVDKELDAKGSKLPRGRAAIANAKAAYKAFREAFGTPRFAALAKRGARVQRPLWASTSTKNPAFRDVLYIEELIGRDTVNTLPPETWAAFRDHGALREALAERVEEAFRDLEALEREGVSLAAVTARLEETGVKSFADSFDSLLKTIAHRAEKLRGEPPPRRPDRRSFHRPLERALKALGQANAVSRIWSRDAGLWKAEKAHQDIISASLGWLTLPETMIPRTAELEEFGAGLVRDGIQHVVLLGMGGSSLAPEVLRRTFPPASGRPALHVLDSTHPEAVAATERAAPPERTLYLVASKSGTTAEPLRLHDYFRAKAGPERFAAITDPGTPLEARARSEGWRNLFVNVPDVGGRFSALSYFGLVPAAALGVDVGKLLGSALKMVQACRPSGDPRDNPGLWLGASLAAAVSLGRDKLALLIPPQLGGFGLWLEQLLAESTGKEGGGLLPIADEPLSRAALPGPDRVFAHVRLEAPMDRALEELAVELEEAGQPVLRTRLEDRYDLGAEFYRWEFAAAVLGAALGIDPFDQPDVQGAKERTNALLKRMRDGTLPPPEGAAEENGLTVALSKAARSLIGPSSQSESLPRLLATAREGEYLALLGYLDSSGSCAEPLAALRAAVQRACRRPVSCGYGPRYLHSTGQFHKGGPDSGVFLVVHGNAGGELPIPGAGYGFASLCRAQALGDFAALGGAGRRAAFVDLGRDVKGGLARLAKALENTPAQRA